MDPDFWKARWAEGRIGFHEGHANALFARHADAFAGKSRILVPLCGKSEDMAYLASRGHEVCGIELVEDAVRAFFQEHSIEPSVRKTDHATVYEAQGITIFAGDVFSVTREDVGAVDALYDRAALVALPAELRKKYVAHVRSLLPQGALGMLVAFEYPQERMPGPPFSVDEKEVRSLYAGAQVELLEEAAANEHRFAQAGLVPTERLYRITL
ncbi:Thiopurine S-methyltransferase [Labilithrix luteola]|uniref:Thiopurine S-methyltransferase n=1 Tax=Labilithrix luteola TaxID=1391654 RepID=A0A0K1PR68_9BACT|nr:thiopurine S-methyltransferase [Labilithrix luteola]AKU96028.1 Thiopurine S-methyltransferase [Labilithrix luteola]